MIYGLWVCTHRAHDPLYPVGGSRIEVPPRIANRTPSTVHSIPQKHANESEDSSIALYVCGSFQKRAESGRDKWAKG